MATLPNLPNLNFLFGEGGEDYSLETEVKGAKQLHQGPDHLGGYQNPASMSSMWASLAPSQYLFMRCLVKVEPTETLYQLPASLCAVGFLGT